LTLASPRDPAKRGSQVSFRFADGYAAMQACIAHGVVGDFRAPDIMRFGFTPLFIDADDVTKAVAIISRVMQDKLWDAPAFRQKAAVT
ncbi:MAG: kynureninase, partial [Yoonia sp.]